jgi:hypothetical protein
MFHTAWEIGCQIQNRLVSPREPRDTVPCSREMRAKQLQTADRPVEQVEGLEQLIANVAAEGIDGRLADARDPDVFRDLRGRTGWAGFSARILYLAGLLAQFRLVYERARSRKIAFGYHRLSPAPPASCVSRPSPGPTWETPLRKGTRKVTSPSLYPRLGRLTAITSFLPTMVPHSATHRGGVRRGRSRSGGLDPRPRPP